MAIPESGPGAVDVLRQSLAALINESQQLRTDVHEAEKARKRASMISLAVIALLALFSGMLLVITWQNNHLVSQVHKTNEFISDCTTPTGECARQSSARTADAIGDIIRANVYMAECARLYPGLVGPEYDQKLESCVYGRLAEAARQRAQATPAPSPSAGR